MGLAQEVRGAEQGPIELVRFPPVLSDDITYHGIACSRECPSEDPEETKDVAHGIGYGKASLSMMLYQDIEKFPADQAYSMLKDKW